MTENSNGQETAMKEALLLSNQQLKWLLEELGIEQKCSIRKSRTDKVSGKNTLYKAENLLFLPCLWYDPITEKKEKSIVKVGRDQLEKMTKIIEDLSIHIEDLAESNKEKDVIIKKLRGCSLEEGAKKRRRLN